MSVFLYYHLLLFLIIPISLTLFYFYIKYDYFLIYNSLFSCFKNTTLIFTYLEVLNFLLQLYLVDTAAVPAIVSLNFVMCLTLLFYRKLTFCILKANKKIKYWYFKKLLKFYKTKSKVAYIMLFSFKKHIYDFQENYPLIVLTFLIIIAFFFNNYILVILFSIKLLYTSILNLEYFKDFKRIRNSDILKFNYHWSSDRDLIVLNKIFFYLKMIGLIITLFSYFFNITHLGKLGCNHTFYLIEFCVSFSKIQYFCAINLIGPSVIIFCILSRFLLNLHVIYFRNPWTILKGVATFVTSAEAGVAIAGLALATSATVQLNSEYGSGPSPHNLVKNTWDFHVQGVVRHTIKEEELYQILKKKEIDLPLDDIREYKSRFLSLPKLKLELSLRENSSELDKLSPLDLHGLGFTDLIKEKELLRYNLGIYQKIGAKLLTKSSYIYQYDSVEKNNFSIYGLNPPSEDEIHEKYKKLTMAICKTSRGRADLDNFLDGKSNKVFYDFKYDREFGSLTPEAQRLKQYLREVYKFDNIKTLNRVFTKLPPLQWDSPNNQEELAALSAYLKKTYFQPLPLLIKNEPENP